MNTMDDRQRPISERYLTASSTSDLSMRDERCDADVLLAAGYAAAGNVGGQLALSLWRLQAIGDTGGLAQLIEESTNWIVGRSHRVGRGQLPRINRVAARLTAQLVLMWWMAPTCPACMGRGHPLIPGSMRVDDSRECGECHGTGDRPVELEVGTECREHARWLAGEYSAKTGAIFKAMADRIKVDLSGFEGVSS